MPILAILAIGLLGATAAFQSVSAKDEGQRWANPGLYRSSMVQENKGTQYPPEQRRKTASAASAFNYDWRKDPRVQTGTFADAGTSASDRRSRAGSFENGLEGMAHDASVRFDQAGQLPAADGVFAPSDRAEPVRLSDIPKIKPASRALGTPQDGRLENGKKLPDFGRGYAYVHAKTRGRSWGTDEMVLGFQDIASRFMDAHPGDPGIRIGDISKKGGGAVSNHHSHENGRDIDIIFLASDKNGNPVEQNAFLSYDSKGRRGNLRFDAARNWDLVVGMVEEPQWDIQYIFVDEDLRSLLLARGRAWRDAASGAEKERRSRTYGRARSLLRHWDNHENHFHIRIQPRPRTLSA